MTAAIYDCCYIWLPPLPCSSPTPRCTQTIARVAAVLQQCLALDCVHIAANVQMHWMCAVMLSKGCLNQCCEASAPCGGMMLLCEPDKDACAHVCAAE